MSWSRNNIFGRVVLLGKSPVQPEKDADYVKSNTQCFSLCSHFVVSGKAAKSCSWACQPYRDIINHSKLTGKRLPKNIYLSISWSSILGWTLWETERVERFGRMALKHVKYHVWNELPVQVLCTILDAWGWCTGTTQRDGMGREEGSGWGTHVYLWWIHFDILQN